jgi:hypothetical protein
VIFVVVGIAVVPTLTERRDDASHEQVFGGDER